MSEKKDRQKLVVLLYEANTTDNREKKITSLNQIEEILINGEDKSLLGAFLKEVLSFQLSSMTHVKKFLASFIEKACDADLNCIPRCSESLLYLLNDLSPNVLKRVISSSAFVYPRALQYLLKHSKETSDISKVWSILTQIKRKIIDYLENSNEGIRSHAFHFVEMLAICYSPSPPSPLIVATKKGKSTLTADPREKIFHLDMILQSHPLLNVNLLKQEGEKYVARLLASLSRTDIPYTSTCIVLQSLFNIAKQRPCWWNKIIPAICKFDHNLPPRLTESQKTSLKMSVKNMLLYLLKMPSTKSYRNQLVKTLSSLDCKPEIYQSAIKLSDRATNLSAEAIQKENNEGLKRQISTHTSDEDMPDKKQRKTSHDTTESTENTSKITTPPDSLSQSKQETTFITEMVPHYDTPLGRLSVKDIIDISFQSLMNTDLGPSSVPNLPSLKSIPSNFNPFHSILAKFFQSLPLNEQKFLQNLLTNPPPAPHHLPVQVLVKREPKKEQAMPVHAPEFINPIQNRIAPPTKQMSASVTNVEEPVQEIKPKIKEDIEDEITQQKIDILSQQFTAKAKILDESQKNELIDMNLQRLLSAETELEREGRPDLRIGLLVRAVSQQQEGGNLSIQLLDHIKEDFRKRFDLAIQWLIHEYFTCIKFKNGEQNASNNNGDTIVEFSRYDRLFDKIVDFLEDNLETNDLLFSQFLVESPRITKHSIEIVNKFVKDKHRVTLGLIALRDLILRNEKIRFQCLNDVLAYTADKDENVQTQAIRIVKNQLYIIPLFHLKIEEFAGKSIEQLLNSSPVEIEKVNKDVEEEDGDVTMKNGEDEKYGPGEGETHGNVGWQTEKVKQYSLLFLALCSTNERLLDKLISVYTGMKYCKPEEEPKKTLLIELEKLVRTSLGTESPYILQFLRDFPDDAEELALSFVQNLVEMNQGSPSTTLVNIIRDIFFKRNKKNARFLIPILQYLSRDEITSSLKNIVELPDKLLESAIQKVMSVNSQMQMSISPSEFLVALHQIDNSDKQLLKRVITAINMCFKHKSTLKQNTLAIAIQQLVELDPIPPQFMRTVIQSVQLSKDLSGFVVGILKRLIQKKVWENEVLWEGFIKCTKMKQLLPWSFDVLAQLPQRELKKLIEKHSDLKEPMLRHVSSMSNPNRQVLSILES